MTFLKKQALFSNEKMGGNEGTIVISDQGRTFDKNIQTKEETLMKENIMKRMIAIVLVLCTMVSLSIPAFAAENDYTCSDYTDCTANGAEIYIITNYARS